jgi:signal transduction histidine kinase
VTGSVRSRLTGAVVLVVGAVAVTGALLAPRSVENALIDDRLDAEVPSERAALGIEFATVSGSGDALGSPELTALFGPDLADLTASLERSGALERLRSFRPDGTLVVAPVAGVLGEIESNGRIRVDDRSPLLADGPIVTGSRLEQLSGELNPPTVFESPSDIFAGGDASLQEFLADLTARFDEDIAPRLDLGELGDLQDLGDLSNITEELFGDEFFRNFEQDVLAGRPPLPQVADPPGANRTVDQLVFGTRDVDGVEVIVAAPSDGIALTVDRLRTALWITVPIAMALTGLVTWLLAGRALRPVRLITEQTGRIRAGTLHERVPVPASHDEIAGLATEMNDMLDRLHGEDRRRRQFVADASHELRSPIASIHTQAEVVIAEAHDAAATELATGVLAEAERLGTIVDDLLALAHHDEALAPPGAIVDLDDIVLTAATRPRRVPVDTAGVSGGQVRGRPDELARAVTHLLDNAARHATSTVRVGVTTVENRVVLRVDDDGPGIDPGDRDRIFERFVRLDHARVRDDGGAGLGLAVVATVVAAAGGSVTVAESDLGGARFEVSLPVAR